MKSIISLIARFQYQFLGGGVIFLASAVWAWWKLSKLEAEGGTATVNKLVADLYTSFGLWPTVLTLAAIGLVSLAVGVAAFALDDGEDEEEHPA